MNCPGLYIFTKPMAATLQGLSFKCLLAAQDVGQAGLSAFDKGILEHAAAFVHYHSMP